MRHITKTLVEKRYKELPLCAKCDIPHDLPAPEVHRHPLLFAIIKQSAFRILSWMDMRRKKFGSVVRTIFKWNGLWVTKEAMRRNIWSESIVGYAVAPKADF